MADDPNFQPQSNQVIPYAPVPVEAGGGKATASVVLGIISLVVWLCPAVGLAVAVVGVVLGSIAW